MLKLLQKAMTRNKKIFKRKKFTGKGNYIVKVVDRSVTLGRSFNFLLPQFLYL